MQAASQAALQAVCLGTSGAVLTTWHQCLKCHRQQYKHRTQQHQHMTHHMTQQPAGTVTAAMGAVGAVEAVGALPQLLLLL